MKNLFISLIIISSNWLIAQKESSNWIVGYGKNNDSTTRFGKSILNFRKDTVNLSSSSLYQYPQMGFVNASISNKDGELILMTDGFSIYGSDQIGRAHV